MGFLLLHVAMVNEKRGIMRKACELYDKFIEINKYPKELDDYYCYLTS